LKSLSEVEMPTESPSIEESNTESYFVDSIADEPSIENLKSDETPEVNIGNGRFFELKLTIEETWNDDYLNRSSDIFKQLGKNLGAELIDLADNSLEAKEINTTNFKLIEVWPAKVSAGIYVTFLMTSENEIDGENLHLKFSNQIRINNEIYTYKATLDGFVFKKINEERVEQLMEESNREICDVSGNFKVI
jgi:hypothetical protein